MSHMTPDDVRQHLALRVGGRVALAPSGDREAILASISSSYFRLRRGMAALALAFPVVLWLGSGARRVQGSISAYYHFGAGGSVAGSGMMRDVFVGILWAIGGFLFFYRGYSRAEDRALNIAGLAAVVIALAPMDWPAGAAATRHGHIHGIAAVAFFLAIAYVSLFRANDTLILLPPTDRAVFRRLYRLLGILMIAIPLMVAAIHFVAPRPNSPMIFAIEVGGIYVFAAFWLVKSREIARIERS